MTIELIVVKLPEAKKGFVLLPKRWVMERSFAWTARFRRLARDFERTPETFRSLHFLAFAILMLHNFVWLGGTARVDPFGSLLPHLGFDDRREILMVDLGKIKTNCS